jgi:hypothetical protein
MRRVAYSTSGLEVVFEEKDGQKVVSSVEVTGQ